MMRISRGCLGDLDTYPKMKAMRRLLLWIVAIALMAGLVWWGREDLVKLRDFRLPMAMVCLALTFCVALASVLKWRMALTRLGYIQGPGFRSLFHYFVLGRTLGLLLPVDFTDFVVRSASLSVGHSVPVGCAAYSIYFDRIFDIIAGLTIVVPSMLFIFGKLDLIPGLYISGVLLVTMFFVLRTGSARTISLLRRIFEIGLKAFSKLPWVGKHLVLPEEIVSSSQKMAGVMVGLYLLSVIKLFFNALRFVVIAEAIGLSLRSWALILFFPGAQLASVLSFTPGGLGITDWSWGGLLYAMGVNKVEIVPYLVSFRLVVSLSLVIMLGISTLLYSCRA